MIRKLVSSLLCAFALLLLMGAGVASEQTTSILAEEESGTLSGSALTTKTQADLVEQSAKAVPAAASESPIEVAESVERGMRIDGEYAPTDVAMTRSGGTTYVALAGMAKALDPAAAAAWDGGSGTVTVTTPKMTVTAKNGQSYLVANGRYLYLPDKVQMSNGRVIVPLWAVAQAFDAKIGWDATANQVIVTRGSGAIQSGASYYNSDTLFWLSRIIYAESGNQSLKGQMAVGNVVMNRVASPVYPNTVKGVLAQKNQFTTYQGGALANRTPNASSVIAAKLVMDGGVVEEVRNALFFDSTAGSWASRHKQCIAVIGGHKFYQ